MCVNMGLQDESKMGDKKREKKRMDAVRKTFSFNTGGND